MVTVLVGETEEALVVHEDLLRSNSAFFDAALSHDWKEKEQRIVKLPDVKPETFSVYAKWLYTRRFFVMTDNDNLKDTDDDSTEKSKNQIETYETELARIFDVYSMGDYLQDSDFKDATIDVIINGMVQMKCYPLNFHGYIYPFSSKQSSHRSLAVELVLHVWAPSSLKYLRGENVPREFLADLAVAMGEKLRDAPKKMTPKEFFESKGACYFHDHSRMNTQCYKVKLKA